MPEVPLETYKSFLQNPDLILKWTSWDLCSIWSRGIAQELFRSNNQMSAQVPALQNNSNFASVFFFLNVQAVC